MTRAWPVLLLLAAGVAGCGGAKTANAVSGQAVSTTASGQTVFADHCATCHSISGHAAARQQGGDLRGLHLSRAELVQYAAEMPAVHGRVNRRELQAVVAYVHAIEAGQRQ